MSRGNGGLDVIVVDDWPGMSLEGVQYTNRLRASLNLPPLPLSLARCKVGPADEDRKSLRLMFFTAGESHSLYEESVLVNPKWCAMGDYEFTVCSFPTTEGDHIVKNVARGGITCEKCLRTIKHMKAIRL